MGRGNSLLCIHRWSGRVQPTSEPVSAAFNRTLYVRSNIAPESTGGWPPNRKVLQPALKEKFVLDNPLS